MPTLYDVGARDSRSIMDVAVFRLSKRDKRAGEVIHYELTDGYHRSESWPGWHGSVWDYDLVLMMVSHMTEAMNRYREDPEGGGQPSDTGTLVASESMVRVEGGDKVGEVILHRVTRP